MLSHFIFDVDGTLTPSRQRIDHEFASYFYSLCDRHKVYLVSGSDYAKTVEQLGEKIVNKVETVYSCSGSDVWKQGKNIRTSHWQLPTDCEDWLRQELNNSLFPLRTGNHIEKRPGAVNFSIVGRGATLGERKLYVEWDEKYNERELLAHNFNTLFENSSYAVVAKIGGETGLDISPVGCDKSQILVDFNKENDFIVFFGDKMEEGGNDFPLADTLFKSYQGSNYKVDGWKYTWELLKKYVEMV